MKMNVIFIPYWILATIGFSEMKLSYERSVGKSSREAQLWIAASGKGIVFQPYSREDAAADGEGKRDDEQHEERHLCYQEQEDLELWLVSDEPESIQFCQQVQPNVLRRQRSTGRRAGKENQGATHEGVVERHCAVVRGFLASLI